MLKKILSKHREGMSLAIYLSAAVLTGIVCVLFMRVFDFVFEKRLELLNIGPWIWLATPLLFLLSVELIRRMAPFADGAGIPQTIYAAGHLSETNFKSLGGLVSFRTMSVKIIAILIGLWAGASTGREGPTVHIAACLFFVITFYAHRFFKLPFNMRSAVIAGGAAGLAAAFNTPLAGVAFAIEELSADYFSSIKEMVLMAIIVAGLAAKAMTGEYIYFGQLAEPEPVSIFTMIAVGLCAGAAGTLFSVLIVEGRKRVALLHSWQRILAVACLAGCVLFLTLASGVKGIAGPGNGVAQEYVQGHFVGAPGLFLVSKMAATLFTYWSGIAGGIFAPCLAMGAGVGAWVASWQGTAMELCAVLGMAAFLAGTIQAPITSFVIIYEMTGHHQAILPIMLAALVGYMTARTFRAKHLYQTLAVNYGRMADSKATKAVIH